MAIETEDLRFMSPSQYMARAQINGMPRHSFHSKASVVIHRLIILLISSFPALWTAVVLVPLYGHVVIRYLISGQL